MPVSPGSPAPDLSLPGPDGVHRSLAFPVVGELARRFGDAAPVVAVSQDPIATAAPWLAARGFAGEVLDDSGGGYPASVASGVEAVPTVVVVDTDGTVLERFDGWSRDHFNAVASLLAERTGRSGAPVSTVDDGRPSFKPG